MSVFEEREKTGLSGEKPFGAKERTNNKLNPRMASTPGFQPGPDWWEASALTTAPPMLLLVSLYALRRRGAARLFWGLCLSTLLCGRRSKPKNWIGKGQLPRCHTPSTVWHGWADFFRISVLCLQKSPYELSWLCSLMKFVRHLLHNSKAASCLWVKTLTNNFIAELTLNSYILVT